MKPLLFSYFCDPCPGPSIAYILALGATPTSPTSHVLFRSAADAEAWRASIYPHITRYQVLRVATLAPLQRWSPSWTTPEIFIVQPDRPNDPTELIEHPGMRGHRPLQQAWLA